MAVQNDRQEQSRTELQRIVLKFGGTSVGKFAPEIASICLYIVSPSSFVNELRWLLVSY